MRKTVDAIILLILSLLVGCGFSQHSAESYLDSPEPVRETKYTLKPTATYDEALHIWKTPEDISAWIAANFAYDRRRAISLSETQRATTGSPAIRSPEEFFATRSGVCLDLSRFGVETLRQIQPDSEARYLMIEFEPVSIDGNTLRLHWIATYKRDGQHYFFADSKRPGRIDGPYDDVNAFIRDYANYRGRKVVAYRELDSYQKQRRTQSTKESASPR